MSCGGKHEIPCNEVLNSVGLLIDGEIHEISQLHSIEVHFEECLPCREEMEHERLLHQMLHEMLTRSCHESAPQELHDQIAYQLATLKQGPPDFVTEYRRTEISIQVDEFGNVEHRETTVETSWIHERAEQQSPEASSES